MINLIITEDGSKFCLNEKGEYHCDIGPAIELSDRSRFWYINGLVHREDGPAVIVELDGNCIQEWWIEGKLIR